MSPTGFPSGMFEGCPVSQPLSLAWPLFVQCLLQGTGHGAFPLLLEGLSLIIRASCPCCLAGN